MFKIMFRLINIICLFQFLFCYDVDVLIDTLHADIESILNFEEYVDKSLSKIEAINYYNEMSILIYNNTLNLEKNTKEMILNYNSLINSLENRLDIEPTTISYNLGAPFIEMHYKYIEENRKNFKNNLHFYQTSALREQYIKLIRYHYKVIDICEKRVEYLLNLLDKSSLDRLIEDVSIEKHLIVMSFNNISNNIKYDELTSVFPEIIINRYKNRDDVQVNYSGKIDPDLRKIPSTDNNLDKYLIDGEFSIDGYEIKVIFKIYDINKWELINSDNIVCDIRDLDCLYDEFLWKLKKSVDPIVSYEIYDDFSNNSNNILNKATLDSLDSSKRNDNLFEYLLEDYAVQKDYSFDIKYKDFDLSQNEKIKTQTFDLSKHPNSILSKKELQANLLKKIENFFKNPYEISIGDLKMNLNDIDQSYVNINVPITYKIKKRDFEKVIKKMPYNLLKSNDVSHIFEFKNDNYLFDNNFSSILNKHSNELFPVLFFANKNGDIQKIIIDSWDDRYDNLLLGDYDVERQNLFVNMYSIINNNSDIQVNISKKDQVVHYQAVIPVSILDNYTQLSLKVFTREDLNIYLPINEKGF